MSGRIFLGSFRNVYPKLFNIENLCGRYRFFSQNVASKVSSLESQIVSDVPNGQLQVKEVKFIGSDKLRRSTPQEIQNDPKLLKELSEAYKMMAQDKEVTEATNFCASVMLKTDK